MRSSGGQRVARTRDRLGPLVGVRGARQLGEERGRVARLLRVCPTRSRTGEQRRAGPGERDVGEPAFLELRVVRCSASCGRLTRSRTSLRSAASRSVEHGQIGAVTAQRHRQYVARACPVDVAGLSREHLLDQAGNGDDVPLESLRAVHGEHLHPLGLDDDLARLEPVLLVLGRVEVGEEGGEGRLVGLVGEIGGLVEEPVEVRPADSVPIGTRSDLDVHADRALDVGHEFGQRRRHPATQPPKFLRERRQPRVPRRRVAGRPARGRRAPRSASAARRAPASLRPARDEASRRARSRSAARSRAPMRHRAPVSSRARAEPRSCRTSTRRVATTSTTSGVVSRPPSPTISTGSPSACSASASSGICERRRTSTAAVRVAGLAARPTPCAAARRPSAPRPRRSACAPCGRARRPGARGGPKFDRRDRRPQWRGHLRSPRRRISRSLRKLVASGELRGRSAVGGREGRREPARCFPHSRPRQP